MIINVCIPALRARGLLEPQFSIYGVIPPAIVSIAVPLLSLAQATFVVTVLALRGAG